MINNEHLHLQIQLHLKLLSNFFPSASVNRTCDDFILELYHQGITYVFSKKQIVFWATRISYCQMTQCDDKLHPWFQSLSVVGVFFFYEGCGVSKHGWGDSSRRCRRTLDHPGGAPPSADDNDPRLFSSQVSASSSSDRFLVFSFFFLALSSRCTLALLPTKNARNQHSTC